MLGGRLRHRNDVGVRRGWACGVADSVGERVGRVGEGGRGAERRRLLHGRDGHADMEGHGVIGLQVLAMSDLVLLRVESRLLEESAKEPTS